MKKTLLHLVMAGLGAAIGIFGYPYASAHMPSIFGKVQQENNDKSKKFIQLYQPEEQQKDVLRVSKNFGPVIGNQDALLPSFLELYLIKPNARQSMVYFCKKNITAGDRSPAYLSHGNNEDETFSLALLNAHNIEGIAVRAETIYNSQMIKKIGESKDTINFTLPKSPLEDLEEVVIKAFDEGKDGDDLIALCRAPIVYGDPKKKVYMDKFDTSTFSLVELDGKQLGNLTIEVKIPELGVTNVYYMSTEKNRESIALDWHLPNLNTPKKLTLKICVRDQKEYGKVVSRFNRELHAVPHAKDGKDLLLIDPYDSTQNSAQIRENREKVEWDTKGQRHWLYAFHHIPETARITQEFWGTDHEIIVDSINAEEEKAHILRKTDPIAVSYGIPQDSIIISKNADSLWMCKNLLDRIQIRNIYGNKKSLRYLDFNIFDYMEAPTEKK